MAPGSQNSVGTSIDTRLIASAPADAAPPERADDLLREARKPWWKLLGPGLITGAADDDPSGIAIYSQAGAQFGYSTCWSLLFTFPLMVGIQLASARIGRVTGQGLTETFARLCPAWTVQALVGLLVLANVVNLGADLNAMGDAVAMVIGGSEAMYGVAFGLISLLLQIRLSYDRYVRFLKWLTLSLFAYVAVVFVVHVDWTAALHATLLPTWQWNRDYTTTMVAILGTTISPYLFFWQAGQEVEEIKRVPADQPLRLAPEQVAPQLRRIKIDTYLGMGVSNLVAFSMILATAATLHAHGATHIETTRQAATALKPVAGELAFVLFACGIVGTGLLALPVLAGSAAYAVASLLRLRCGLSQPFSAARPFYAILGAAMVLGIAVGVAGIDPMKALYAAAVINAVISVPIMATVMLAASSPRIMGTLALSLKWKVLGWAATAVMAAAMLAMAVVSIF